MKNTREFKSISHEGELYHVYKDGMVTKRNKRHGSYSTVSEKVLIKGKSLHAKLYPKKVKKDANIISKEA